MQVLDGGGGNDCIVTFKDGPPYVAIGGPGNDRIVANVPPGTTDEQIDAICASKPPSEVGKLSQIPTISADVRAGGLRVSLKKEGPATDWTPIAVLLLAIVAILSLWRVVERRRSRARSVD
jgi:hypothetical protein